jgi:signal transduction histidine kinase
VRATAAITLILICGSFASAAAVQLRLDRGRALDQAAQFETRRAQEIANDLAATLDRFAALGVAFANARGTAETAAALSEAGGAALRNIVVLSRDGSALSEMKGAPGPLLPVDTATLSQASLGHAVIPVEGTGSVALLIPAGVHIVAIEIDRRALLRHAGMEETVVATRAGRILDLGKAWKSAPAMSTLSLSDGRSASRFVGSGAERRLVALSVVPGWPLVAAASVRTGEALRSWYASLPLFIFIIIGPAIAGAGLAVIFVREFERRARATGTLRTLRAAAQGDAKLLIRLADAERRAAEAVRAKSEFVAHMSHELRTPLNAIIGFSEVIAQGFFGDPGHPKYVEYANDIGAAGRHLHAKIGDVLEFANLEAGRHPISSASIDVSAIARFVVDELAGRAFSRRIRLTVSLSECAPGLGDAQAVKRILTNLLTNALEYSPEGSAVRVQVRSEPGAIVASIRDGGIGFSTEERNGLGTPFTHFERPGAVTGVGLGLAIAMTLARQMGGVIRMVGAPGESASAELRLPKA